MNLMWTYYSRGLQLETCLVLKSKPCQFHYETTLLSPCGKVTTVERYDSELFLSPDRVIRTYEF